MKSNKSDDIKPSAPIKYDKANDTKEETSLTVIEKDVIIDMEDRFIKSD